MPKPRKDNAERVARVFGALGNLNRLRIFLRLASCCEPGTKWAMGDQPCACVGDLGRDLGIVPSTVSHHIKELQAAGLIKTERRGQKIMCWIAPETLKELADFFTQMAPNPGERT